MHHRHWHKRVLWGLAWCLLASVAYGQDTPPSSGMLWFEVESNALPFGTLEPGVEPLPEPLVVRVHSDQAWALKLIPTPGLIVETGGAVPLDRLYWRPNSTGLFIPFDTSGPLTIASGPATGGDGELVLTELALRLEENDPIGHYRYNLRLFLGAVDPSTTTPTSASPGQTNDETITVTASNPGVFFCMVGATTFDFGDIDVQGADYGTANVVANGRNGANTGGEYESASGLVNWTCSTLPSSVVNIALVSATADHTGGMEANNLEVRIPVVAGGTSEGYQPFASGANLITGMSVGIGANAARGQLDLRLTVLDTDPAGVNAWVVRLRATGNP